MRAFPFWSHAAYSTRERTDDRIRRLEAELEAAREEAHQARQILDLLTQERVFICDMSPPSEHDQGNVLYYVNKVGKATLADWASELRAAFGVNAATVQGTSIHAFHKNPERIREIFRRLAPGEPRHNADIPVGEHVIRSVSHALTNRKGEVVGVVATWVDVTDEVRYRTLIQSEIAQVAAAMEEMTATVNEIAANAHRAAERSSEAAACVREGEGASGQLVGGMDVLARTIRDIADVIRKLGEASGEIGAIIQVIDDIADQTNLLALNAAIEAARAGDSGRGFAVVADEVRKLAERTTKATKEIIATIESAQGRTSEAVRTVEHGRGQMEQGMTHVAAVSAALRKIAASSQQVLDVTHQIATATEEQSAAVAEVARSMNMIQAGHGT
jgi:methyl-accepting chemotaxis protein